MCDPRFDLERIVICAERVFDYTDALTFEEFVADKLRYDATLRNLEIMGEAATMGNLRRSLGGEFQTITDAEAGKTEWHGVLLSKWASRTSTDGPVRLPCWPWWRQNARDCRASAAVSYGHPSARAPNGDYAAKRTRWRLLVTGLRLSAAKSCACAEPLRYSSKIGVRRAGVSRTICMRQICTSPNTASECHVRDHRLLPAADCRSDTMTRARHQC